MSLLYVTPHFSWAEFDCHSGVEVPDRLKPNIRRLCNSLELVRERYGAALTVISGYRDPAYNKRIGGAKASQHMNGTAADIRPVELAKVQGLAELVARMLDNGELPGVGGFGIYKNWIHLDVRPRKPSGKLYLWYGTGVGSEK